MTSFNDKLTNQLKKDLRFVDDESEELIRSEIVNEALKIDKKLIEALLSDKDIKAKFFTEIKGHWVFEMNTFIEYVQDKNFLNNSYTKFKNKIGLNIGGKFLNERREVSLVWPFKDCILEAGMTKEDQKRNEIFFNETLAQDEIDRLLDPKVLTNFKRYTAKGEEKVTEIKRDKQGTLSENLIIKGNNLFALHSLKKEFQNKVKLIYIDPPYNTGNDEFGYNDSFNHSAWLTFMKNRLDAAKILLKDDGAIFIQIDHHELAYLSIMMDEIFGVENKVQIISVKTASPAGFKTVNPGPIDVTEYVLFYTKNKRVFNFKRSYVAVDYHENYNQVIVNYDDRPEKWTLRPIKEILLEENGIEIGASRRSAYTKATEKWGSQWKIILDRLVADYALKNKERVVSIRDPHKPTEKLKDLLNKSKTERNKIFVYERTNGDKSNQGYVINGGALAFYSNKVRELDGKMTPTELLTDFWNDMSWAGIAKEGGVRLKNGKKPEKLIKRIIEMVCDESDIIMDYHLGSGTTCSVAHKMNYQYIGIEQLDYGKNDPIERMKNVINGDSSGISALTNWKGGGDFIFCELMKHNEAAIDKIEAAKSTDDLLKVWKEMVEHFFLNYDVDIKRFNDAQEDFKKLPLEKQKRLLAEMINKNQLYVNLSEIDDAQFKVSKDDKTLNEKFYK